MRLHLFKSVSLFRCWKEMGRSCFRDKYRQDTINHTPLLPEVEGRRLQVLKDENHRNNRDCDKH